MLKKRTIQLITCLFCAVTTYSTSAAQTNTSFTRHLGFYIGPSVGYGSTNWKFLTTKDLTTAATSSPIGAKDTGAVYGAIGGYQINPYFAVEASYMHYPASQITFAGYNMYWDGRPNPTTIESRTQQAAFYLKLMVPFNFWGDTNVYSGIGLEETFRSDVLDRQHNKLGGMFVGGIIHFFNPHIASEVGFDFSTGSAEAETGVAYHYIPFLYQGHLTLLYYFSAN